MPRKYPTSQKSSTNRKPLNLNSQKSQSLSQSTLEQSFSRSQKPLENVDKLVNNCVRYILYRAGNNLPIRKSDLQKNVLQRVGKNFDQVLNKVSENLKETYGFDLFISDESNNTKQYLVSNTLPYKPNPADEEDAVIPPDVNKILIMLVLTHIFMSNDKVNEASIFAFLRSVKIDPEEKHELFGNVKDFVTSTMVKQKYLATETINLTHKVFYFWGSRAEHEISKHEILKFVCKMYKDRQPKSWTTHYKVANDQAMVDEEVEVVDNQHSQDEGEMDESSD